jgi:hypothetical protein
VDEREKLDDLGPHMRNHHRIVAIALGTTIVPYDPDLRVTKNNRGITTVSDMEVEVDDPGHHNKHMITHVKETPGTQSRKLGSTDPATSGMSTIMRMKKSQWEPPALLIGFTECKYPKDLSYLMTSRNTMDRKSPSHGCQIICRLSRYSRGSKATTMQSLQLHLIGVARSWLGKLPLGYIDIWYELER